MHILNVSDATIIHARKCTIKEIDTKTKNKFLDKFHLQGADRSKIKLGAFYEEQLISVMTFSKGSIAKGGKTKDNEYELNRFCSDYNFRITGISSRLFKHFIRNYSPKKIYTYADKRWSDGNLYDNLNFKFVHSTDPNYWYMVKDGSFFIRKHRFNFRKSELENKLKNFNPDISEWKNMQINGFDRIWDCGNIKYEYY